MLTKALEMLKMEDVPSDEIFGTIKALTEIAVSIDMLNLQWNQVKSQSWAHVFDNWTSSRPGEES